MIFAIEGHVDQIISGDKTQTRRRVKSGQYGVFLGAYPGSDFVAVSTQSGRHDYAVGHDYAVQPGRAKPGVWWNPDNLDWIEVVNLVPVLVHSGYMPLRIRITAIRREDIRQISEADALAEGGYTPFEYVCLWAEMYDKRNIIESGSGTLRNYAATRPAALYDCWALTFEVVK